MEKNISGNIYKLYIIKVAKWFMLIMPIMVLFYEQNGMDLKDVFTLRAIYSIAIVALEIPSGYFADVWGRKYTIIIGSILGAVGFVIYSVSFGFWGFLIASVVLGIGESFISGSDSAMLYDTLLQAKREKEYTKMEGRVISVGNFAETIAALIGGLLAEISLRTPFYAQAVISFIAIPAAFMLIEPERYKIPKKYTLKNIFATINHTLVKHKKMKWIMLYSSFIGTATLTMAWLVQPYLDELLHFSPWEIGLIIASLNLTVGLITLLSHKIETLLGQVKIIFFIGILIVAGYLFSGFRLGRWSLLIFLAFYFARGIATPVLRNYINQLTTSDVRATVLSIRSFIIRIFFAAIGPLIGWYSDKFNLYAAMFLAGFLFLITCSISIVFLLKYRKANQ